MADTDLNEKNSVTTPQYGQSQQEIAQIFPAYRLQSILTESKETLVYKACCSHTGRKVVIKTPLIKNLNDSGIACQKIEAFNKEISLCAKLHHPNIVQLIDKDSIDNIPYAVFEYIPGISLKDKLSEQGSLDTQETLRLMVQILDALQCIHSQGIIHRDLKPQNIIVTQTGFLSHCKLLDFDAAEKVSISQQEKNDKNIPETPKIGAYTVAYAAPEILRGEVVSTLADYYSWGLIFAECLIGQPVISKYAEQMQISNVELSLPAFLQKHAIGDLLQKAIRKNPKDRYQCISDIMDDLNNIEVTESSFYCESSQPSALLLNDSMAKFSEEDSETRVNQPLFFNKDYKERKYLTILCVNLHCHSTTNLNNEMNLAEVENLYNSFVHKLRYDIFYDNTQTGAGHLVSVGDLLLFQFGYPVASDSDGRLAARTALDVVAELRSSTDAFKQLGCTLDVRIGLHSGEVILDAKQKPFGDTINTAIELTRSAKVGEVLCSQDIQQNLKNYYHFGYERSLPLGFTSQLQDIFPLQSERQSESVGFLRGRRGQYPSVGREYELTLLSQQLKGNSARYKRVYLSGEAGIGKSCLSFELMDKLSNYQHCIAQFLPETQNDSLAGLLTLVKKIFSIDDLKQQQAQKVILDCLGNNIQSNYQKNHIAAILGARLGIDFPEVIDLPPIDEHKLIVFQGLSAMISRYETTAVDKLLVFEDVHWADTTSLEFIAYFASRDTLTNHGILCTSRQGIPNCLEKCDFLIQTLNKLNQQETQQLISQLFDGLTVSNQVLDSIIDRADGVPLFIEELVTMFKDNKWLDIINEELVFLPNIKNEKIPNTLRELLQHRLDKLIHGKSTAQLAATIGREFDRCLIDLASNRTTVQIQNDIDELISCGLIIHQRKVNAESYLFKHALVRDVAYDSMTNDHCLSAHQAVAHSIENTQDINDVVIIAKLSHHYSQCNNYEKSAHYSQMAAQKAVALNEHQQIIYYSEIAFNALQNVSRSIEKQLEISQLLITAKMMTCGWTAVETEQQIKVSQALLEKLGKEDISRHFATCWATATYYNVIGNSQEVLRLTSLALATEAYSEGEQAALHALRAHCYYLRGDFEQSVESSSSALSLYDPQEHKDHAAKYGHDTKVLAANVQVLAYGMLGDYDYALGISFQAEAYATELDNPHSLCMSLIYRSCLYYLQKTPELISPLSNQVAEVCKKYQLSNWPLLNDILQSWSVNNQLLMAKSIDALVAAGATQGLGFWQAMQANILLSLGHYEDVIQVAESAIAGSENRAEQGFIPELEFILAKAYRLKDENNHAKKYYAKAIKHASEKSMIGLIKQYKLD